MSLADVAAAHRDRRILTIDIETAPGTAYYWQARTEYLPASQVITRPRMLCFAAKWLDSKRTVFHDERDGTEPMVRAAWDLLNEADIVVGYNQVRFDVKHLNREFAEHGLSTPAPYKNVDLLRVARSKFALPHYKLDEVAKWAGVGAKVTHQGFTLWTDCMAGDEKAWRQMRRYNMGDIAVTEAVYLALLPWIDWHPHVRHVTGGELACPRCGSADLDRLDTTTAVVHTYALWRCNVCTGLVRAGHVAKVGNTRAV